MSDVMDFEARKGLIISISGPSGVGKGTVISELRKRHPEMGNSISVTTRAPRGNEQDGVEYYFRTKEKFEELIEDGEIIEYDNYVGNYYGTPKTPLLKMTEEGKDVLLDLTIAGSVELRRVFPQKAIIIFLLPPSVEKLRERLVGRGTESPEVIDRRMEQATKEMTKAGSFDYVVINDDLNETVADIEAIIRAAKLKV